MTTTTTLPVDRNHEEPVEIALPIAGMTCASCVNRIERFLAKTPGVEEATVNLATEIATIRYLPDVAGRGELVGAIEAAGYELKTVPPVAAGSAEPTLDEAMAAEDAERAREQRDLALKSGVSIAVAVGIMLAMFWPQTVVPMETINRIVLIPATFIQVWAGGRFYRAAWRALRHGSANMDTLVVAGTSAAWGYSVFVALFPEVVHDAGIRPETYFDSSTIILGLILLGSGSRRGRRAGRPARSAGSSGSRPRRPGSSGATRRSTSPSPRSGPAISCGSARERRSRSTAWSWTGPRRSMNRC